MGGSGFSWGFGYLFLSFVGTGEPQSTSGVGRPGIPFVWANFQGNSRGVLCRLYRGKEGCHDFFLFTPASRLLVHTRGCVVNHTSVLQGQGASWAGTALKSDSWVVCCDGAWATWILVCWTMPNGERAPTVLILVFPIPRAVVQHG